MTDISTLVLATDSKQIVASTNDLDNMTASAKATEAATENLSTAAKSNASAVKQGQAATVQAAKAQSSATTAMNANTTAINANAKAMKQLNFRRTQFAYQANDVISGLIMGQPPMMVATQQGGQLAQIYGGKGGLNAALSDTSVMLKGVATRLWPVAAIAGTVAAATYLMTDAINDSSTTAVSMGDVFMGTFDVVRSGVASVLGPAISAVTPMLNQVTEFLQGHFSRSFNLMVKMWGRGLVEMRTGAQLAAAFIRSVFSTQINAVIGIFEKFSEQQYALINHLQNAQNAIRQKLGKEEMTLSVAPTFSRIEGADFGTERAKILEQREIALGAIKSANYSEQLVSEIKIAAVKRANQKASEAASEAATDTQRARDSALNRLSRKENSIYSARLQSEGRHVELIKERLRVELEALDKIAKVAIANGANAEQVHEQVARVRASAEVAAERDIRAKKDEMAQKIREFDQSNAPANDNGGLNAEMSVIAQQEQEKFRQLSVLRQEALAMVAGDRALELQIEQDFANRVNEIHTESARLRGEAVRVSNDMALQSSQQLAGSLASMAKNAAGEQSAAYKAMVVVEQGIAIARSVMAIQTGVAQAMSLPFPANLGAAATVAAQGASIIASIQNVSTALKGPERRFGGNVTAGMPYTVGEAGKETFVPNSSGKVVPHNAPANDQKTKMDLNIDVGVDSLKVYVDGQLEKEISPINNGMNKLAKATKNQGIALRQMGR